MNLKIRLTRDNRLKAVTILSLLFETTLILYKRRRCKLILTTFL